MEAIIFSWTVCFNVSRSSTGEAWQEIMLSCIKDPSVECDEQVWLKNRKGRGKKPNKKSTLLYKNFANVCRKMTTS